MHKKIVSLLFFIIISIPVYAQNDEEIEGVVQNNFDGILNPPSAREIIDYNISNNAKNGFSAHKQNYLLPYTYSSLPGTDLRKKNEIKFQLSVKQRLLKFRGWAFYFGYTQKSFWQAYDINDSSPFRENNFNPEIFLRTKMWNGLRIDTGWEHESNGQEIPDSRSWNRIYCIPYYENDRLIASLKGWYRLPEDNKDEKTDVDGDDNPDISRYYGYGELGLTLKIPELYNTYIATMSRYNFNSGKGAIEVDLTIPLHLNSMSLMIQYWNGYGESLIDYNVKQQKIGIGLNFTR